jgi:spermidine synthase
LSDSTTTSSRITLHRLALLLFALGCGSSIAQVVLIREILTVFFGNELTLGVVLGVWFVGILCGAWCGGCLDRKRSGTLLTITGMLLIAVPFVLVMLLRHWRGILGTPAGELPGLFALFQSSVMLITPLSFLFGLSFPLICQAAQDSTGDRTLIGRIYVLESMGAIFGGLLVSVLLVSKLAAFELLAVSALFLALGLVQAVYRLAKPIRRTMVIGLLVLMAAFSITGSIAGWFAAWDAYTTQKRFEEMGTGGERVAWAESPYQHLDLASQDNQFSLYAAGKLLATFPDPYRARPRAHLVLTEHRDPRRVLLLGSASFELIPALLTHPIENLDVVELDATVIELVKPFLSTESSIALNDSRVHFYPTDARRFVRETDKHWDVIFSDPPDPTTAAENRSFTTEFFQLCKAHLAPDGILVTRISSSFNQLDPETASLVKSIEASLKTIFTSVLLIPGGETFAVASTAAENTLVDSPDALIERYRKRGVVDPHFDPIRFRSLFTPEQVADLQSQLAEVKTISNTDQHPVSFLFGLMRWGRMEGSRLEAVLRVINGIPMYAWFILAVIIPGGLWLYLRRAPHHKRLFRVSAVSIGMVGALGLALELILIFSYQSVFGSLYHEIGLIVAAFMIGLVLGGLFINRRLSRVNPNAQQLVIGLLLLSGFTALLPVLQAPWLIQSLPDWLGRTWLFGLVVLTGVGTGVLFPLASSLALHAGSPVGRTAGTLDAVDHLGAALGAVFTGVVLVPTLGRDTTCLWLAFLCAGISGINHLAGRSK